MYNCDICNKYFSSNKRLLSHIERCEKRSRERSISTLSRRSLDNYSSKSSCDTRDIHSRSTTRKGLTRRRLSLDGSKSDTELSSQYDEIGKYERVIRKLRDEREKLKSIIDDLENSHLDDMRKKDEYYENHIDELNKDNGILKDSIEDLEQERETLQEQFKIMRTKLRKQYAKKLAKIKLENDNINQVEELEEEIISLKKQLNDSSIKFSQLEDENHSLTQSTTELQILHKQTIDDTIKLNEQLDMMSNQYYQTCDDRIQLNKDIASLKNEINELQKDKEFSITNLTTQLENSQSLVTHTKEYYQEIIDNMKKVFNEEKEHLNCFHLSEIKKLNSTITNISTENDKIAQALQLSKSNNENLLKLQDESQEEIKQLKEQITAVDQQKNHMSNESKKQCLSHIEEKKQLRKELVELKKEIATRDNQISILNTEKRKYQIEAQTTLQTHTESSRRLVEKHKHEIFLLDQKYKREIQNTINEHKNNINKATNEIDHLNKELFNKNLSLKDAQDKLTNHTMEFEKKISKIETQHNDILSSNNEKNKQELSKLIKQNSDLRSEITTIVNQKDVELRKLEDESNQKFEKIIEESSKIQNENIKIASYFQELEKSSNENILEIKRLQDMNILLEKSIKESNIKQTKDQEELHSTKMFIDRILGENESLKEIQKNQEAEIVKIKEINSNLGCIIKDRDTIQIQQSAEIERINGIKTQLEEDIRMNKMANEIHQKNIDMLKKSNNELAKQIQNNEKSKKEQLYINKNLAESIKKYEALKKEQEQHILDLSKANKELSDNIKKRENNYKQK